MAQIVCFYMWFCILEQGDWACAFSSTLTSRLIFILNGKLVSHRTLLQAWSHSRLQLNVLQSGKWGHILALMDGGEGVCSPGLMLHLIMAGRREANTSQLTCLTWLHLFLHDQRWHSITACDFGCVSPANVFCFFFFFLEIQISVLGLCDSKEWGITQNPDLNTRKRVFSATAWQHALKPWVM